METKIKRKRNKKRFRPIRFVSTQFIRVIQTIVENRDFLFLIGFFLLISLLVVYSTSPDARFNEGYYNTIQSSSGGFNLNNTAVKPFVKHVIHILIGICGMFFIALVKNKYLTYINRIIIVSTYILVFMVSIPGLGVIRSGQKRWINIRLMIIQPSDFFKVGLILTLALILSKVTLNKLRDKYIFSMIIVFELLPIMYVLKADLSTAIILMLILFSMLIIFVVRNYKRWLFGLGAGALGSGIIIFLGLKLIGGGAYRLLRVTEWLSPTGSFQTYQGLKAIASGGLVGKGMGKSTMRNLVPESQNDFVFTIFCEEYGIIGGLLLIMLFGLLIYKIYSIAIECKDSFYFFVLIGIMLHISAQVIINIGVTIKLLPNTGIGLPFLSTGGSAMLVFLIELGYVLRASKIVNKQKAKVLTSE